MNPLGTQYKSYELGLAINSYLLDPYQYSVTKFKYSADKVPGTVNGTLLSGGNSLNQSNTPTNGLKYSNADFNKLLPEYTSERKSVKDLRAQDYHRFQANEGFFNPHEGKNNSDLWYYYSTGGPSLNVQEVNHIIFPEPQRGGVDTANLAKYSRNDCFFSYNTPKNQDFEHVYSFDSNYIRNNGISNPTSGTMPNVNFN